MNRGKLIGAVKQRIANKCGLSPEDWSMEAESAVTAVLAELERQGVDLKGWQLIEAAPRDGSFLLLFAADYPIIARWLGNGWYSGPLRLRDVTHWRSLPAAPRERGE